MGMSHIASKPLPRRPGTARIRFNAREPNAELARPGMSVETAVAVAGGTNVSASAIAARIGCVSILQRT